MSWKDDLNYGLSAFGVKIPDTLPIDDWAGKLTNTPARNTAAVVAVSSALFYLAERDHNPKVVDIYDAMIYCSTCLSVGYGDIFAKTPAGKLIGTLLMSIGPSLSGATLDGTGNTNEAILEKLNEIAAAISDNIVPREIAVGH